jgi:5-methylcytosine-specific restriction endonuclease McrA
MSDYVPPALVRLVRDRAHDCCEYCLLPQELQEAWFHIDHVQPRKLDGPTVYENLALACVNCSLKKAARTHALDPLSGTIAALFHPRRDQ